MNDEQKAEANRLISELLKTVEHKCQWNPDRLSMCTEIETKCPKGCKHETCDKYVPYYPDHCGDDNDALAGLKALPKHIGWNAQFDGRTYFVSIWWRMPHEAGDGKDVSVWNTIDCNTLHEAFYDAMVEEYDKRMHNYVLNMPEGTVKAIRIRPAVNGMCHDCAKKEVERLYRVAKNLLAFFKEKPGVTLPREQAEINAMWQAAREMREGLKGGGE